MNSTPIIKVAETNPSRFVGWSIAAALAGLGCVVLPHYLLKPCNYAEKGYAGTLLPWFANAIGDIHFLPAMVSYLVVGIVLGVAQPHRWKLMGLLALSLPTILNAITVATDMMHHSDAHNLFPIEFAILWFVGLPVFVGAFIGSWFGKRAAEAN